MEIKIVYFIAVMISLLVLIGYCKYIKEKENWFIMLYISVLIVNAGYFMMSVSGTLEAALMANRISYLGSVFLPLCMMMIIMDVCRIQCSRAVKSLLIGVSIAVFIIAASQGYCDLYYRDADIVFVDGVTKLVKVYGPLHKTYYIYLFAYFMIMAVMILITFLKKKVFNCKHAVLLLVAVFGNILIWFVEQGLDMDFEFLSISYIFTVLFLLFLYGMLQEHGIIGAEYEQHNKTDKGNEYNINSVLELLPEEQQLTSREKEVLEYLLKDRKRKDIAEELSVTEHTIKKHTAHIFAKLEVSDRKELKEKLGVK